MCSSRQRNATGHGSLRAPSTRGLLVRTRLSFEAVFVLCVAQYVFLEGERLAFPSYTICLNLLPMLMYLSLNGAMYAVLLYGKQRRRGTLHFLHVIRAHPTPSELPHSRIPERQTPVCARLAPSGTNTIQPCAGALVGEGRSGGGRRRRAPRMPSCAMAAASAATDLNAANGGGGDDGGSHRQ